MQYETPTLRRKPGISRQTISHAEAGKIANASCQPNSPTHAIPASDFDWMRATTPILLFIQNPGLLTLRTNANHTQAIGVTKYTLHLF
jgi:hypothetical protein